MIGDLRRAFAAEEVDLKEEVAALMELFDVEEGDRRKLAESDSSVCAVTFKLSSHLNRPSTIKNSS